MSRDVHDSPVRVALLSEEFADDAREVLVRAFAAYPFTSRAFSAAAESCEAMLRRMFDYALRYRLAMGTPALIAIEGESVVGTATLRPPNSPEVPEEFSRRWDEIRALCSPEGRASLDAYGEVEVEFPGPHFYIVAIGTEPSRHGTGIGRKLIDAAVELAAAHPEAQGLALDTHDPQNVVKYRRLGFEVVEEVDLLGMPNWYLWRPVG